MSAVKIGTSTGVKWAQLDEERRLPAIKGVLRGGAKNPHGKTFSLARRYLSRTASLASIRADIAAIPDPRKQQRVKDAISNLIKLHPTPTGEALKASQSPLIRGPSGRLLAGTQPHLILKDGKYLRHICFWANLTPTLHPRGAQMGALLMRQSCETASDAINLFEIIDLYAGVTYGFDVEDLDAEYTTLHRFLSSVERQIVELG